MKYEGVPVSILAQAPRKRMVHAAGKYEKNVPRGTIGMP